ncbi:MAG: archease [Planctomycetes bacterium]|nr:archease [Planctomycetota bacterium]
MSAAAEPWAGGSFRAIEHTADEAYELEGPSYAALLVAAASALCARIGAPGPEAPVSTAEVEVEGLDREDLLVRLAQAVLLRFALEDLLFEAPEALRVEERADGTFSARLRGRFRRVDRGAGSPLTEVKAVTYHDLHVREDESGRWRARLVLDL